MLVHDFKGFNSQLVALGTALRQNSKIEAKKDRRG